MRWLFDFHRYHDEESDIIGLAYKGYTTLIDRVQSNDPNSITLSTDQTDFGRSSSRNHPSTNNRNHQSNDNSGNNCGNGSNVNSNQKRNNQKCPAPGSINIINNNSSSGPINNTTLNNNIVPSLSTSKQLKDGNHLTNSSLLSESISLPNETEIGAIRKSPDGKDNDALRHEDNKLTRDTTNKYRENNGNHQKIGNDISTEIFSTSNDNGKINVQVTVLVDTNQSHAGTTLANLKKQRAQSRNSGTLENGSLIGAPASITSTNSQCNPMPNFARNNAASSLLSVSTNDIITNGPNQSITKFSGVTSDVVSDSTRSRRCCIVM